MKKIWGKELEVELEFTVEDSFSDLVKNVSVYVTHPSVTYFFESTNLYPKVTDPNGRTIDGKYVTYCKLVEWTIEYLQNEGYTLLSKEFEKRFDQNPSVSGEVSFKYELNEIAIHGSFRVEKVKP